MQNPGQRFASIDVLRGLAVVLMFMHHFPLFLMQDYQNSEVFFLLFTLSRFAAPLFLFIVGISMILSAERRVRLDGKEEAARHLAKKGAILFAGGFLLNILINDPLGRLNILQTIGLSIIILLPIAINPRPMKIAYCLLLFFLLSIALPKIAWAKDALDLFGFPPLPWTAFTLFGLFFGYYIKRYEDSGNPGMIPHLFELGALFFMAASLALTLSGQRFDFDSYATASFIALSMGILLYLSSLAFWVYEVYGKKPLMLRPLAVYGGYAFSIYFIHQIFIATIPGLLGLRNAFSLLEVLAFLVVFMAASFLILDRRK